MGPPVGLPAGSPAAVITPTAEFSSSYVSHKDPPRGPRVGQPAGSPAASLHPTAEVTITRNRPPGSGIPESSVKAFGLYDWIRFNTF